MRVKKGIIFLLLFLGILIGVLILVWRNGASYDNPKEAVLPKEGLTSGYGLFFSGKSTYALEGDKWGSGILDSEESKATSFESLSYTNKVLYFKGKVYFKKGEKNNESIK